VRQYRFGARRGAQSTLVTVLFLICSVLKKASMGRTRHRAEDYDGESLQT
jgi:hypothetical protein